MFLNTKPRCDNIFLKRYIFHKTPTCNLWYTFVKITLAVEVGQRTRSEMSPCLQRCQALFNLKQHHVKNYVGTKYKFGVYFNEIVPVLCGSHKDNNISPYSTQRHFSSPFRVSTHQKGVHPKTKAGFFRESKIEVGTGFVVNVLDKIVSRRL